MGGLSVVVPCRDAEATLAQTLGSVLEQTRPPQELLVVDDGSTDETVSIARRFAAAAPEVVQVLQHAGGNAPKARNIGAAAATGERLMFLDADDVLAPDTLEALDDALASRPRGVAICPWWRLELLDGRWVQRPPSCRPRRRGQSPLDAWLRGWYHPPCSVLWSRAAFELVGGWDERCRSNQDGDLMMRALAIGVPLVRTHGGAGYYRRAPEGGTSLSAARHRPEGLRSRLNIVLRLAGLLHGQGRLRSHAAALSYALVVIADDAAAIDPEIAQEAERIACLVSPVRTRTARGPVGQFLGRVRGRVRRALRQRVTSRPNAIVMPPREIHAGTRMAAVVQGGDR